MEKDNNNKDTDKIWFVVCEKCGQVDSAMEVLWKLVQNCMQKTVVTT